MVKNRLLGVLIFSSLLSCTAAPKKLHLDQDFFLKNVLETTDKTLAPIRLKKPEYPESAFKESVEGYCEVTFSLYEYSKSFSISAKKSVPNYRPFNVNIKRCDVDGYFEESCVAAVKSWLFASATGLQLKESDVFTSKCSYKATNL